MRHRHRSRLRELAVIALAASIGGCSTTGSDGPLTTSSIAPRPEEGLRQDPPRYNTAESESPKPYTQPYSQPPVYEPRPRQYVQQAPASDWRYTQPPYAAAQGYGNGAYASRPPTQPYHPQPPVQTWQQRTNSAYHAQGPAPIQTGSLGRTATPSYGAPAAAGSLSNVATTIQVREGDTLYGLSRRTGIPVAEIMAANRLQSQRIEIGQRLVIPARPVR